MPCTRAHNASTPDKAHVAARMDGMRRIFKAANLPQAELPGYEIWQRSSSSVIPFVNIKDSSLVEILRRGWVSTDRYFLKLAAVDCI